MKIKSIPKSYREYDFTLYTWHVEWIFDEILQPQYLLNELLLGGIQIKLNLWCEVAPQLHLIVHGEVINLPQSNVLLAESLYKIIQFYRFDLLQ